MELLLWKLFLFTVLVALTTAYHLDTYDFRNLIKRRMQNNAVVSAIFLREKEWKVSENLSFPEI